jgi:hypothetical protein
MVFNLAGNRRAAIFVADKFRTGRGVFLLANGVTEFMGDLLDDRLGRCCLHTISEIKRFAVAHRKTSPEFDRR